jgi:glutathione S-transferase
MSTTLEVHLDPCTVNSRKLLAALTLLQTPYTLKKVDYFAGEHKSSSYKAINPCATVPCAVIDNLLVLTESNAIITYAGDIAGDNPAYPADKKVRADIQRWLFWETSVWFPSCYVYLIQNVVQPVLGNQPDESWLGCWSRSCRRAIGSGFVVGKSRRWRIWRLRAVCICGRGRSSLLRVSLRLGSGLDGWRGWSVG